jgi:signal transduction histidine kinase
VSRLFLKVYLGIAVVLIVGTLGMLFIFTRGLDDARQRGVEDRLVDFASYIRNRIEAEDLYNDEEELFQLSRASRMVFRIFSTVDDFPDEVKSRLSSDGETFVFWDTGRDPRVYASFADGRILEGRFGRRWEGERRRQVEGPEGRPRDPRPVPGWWGGFGRGPGPPGRFPGPEHGWVTTRSLFLLSVIGMPILLVGPAIYFLIRPLDRRIHALSAVAEKFGEGDLESRAEASTGDALGELTGTFNRMADQIKGLIDGQNDLLRAVSHELRTPLARLFFIVDDAEAAKTDEERAEHLARIQEALTEMNDLVDELLTFLRLDRERNEAERQPVDVGTVFNDLREVANDLRSDVSVEIDCGQVTLQVIPRLFKRAVQNLLTNAVRHAESTVYLSCSENEEHITVAVEDDGSGIPEEQRERILEPFIRVDESRSSRIGGIGLGLAIVNRVVALHDGSIEVSERPEGGARFLLKFPVS